MALGNEKPGERTNWYSWNGEGTDHVMFHGGTGGAEVWTHVLPPLTQYSKVLVLDPELRGNTLRVFVNQLLGGSSFADTSRNMFVGWGDGNQAIVDLLGDPGLKISGLVLTNVDRSIAHSSTALQIPQPMHIPSNTEIAIVQSVSGIRLPASLLATLSQHGPLREIIAGRSNDCVPIERPDVIVDLIIDHLTGTR
jgi:hypothetical protein